MPRWTEFAELAPEEQARYIRREEPMPTSKRELIVPDEARKSKAQRERVVVAWAVVCASGRHHWTGAYTQRRSAITVKATCDVPPQEFCGPHRVVRLEGWVKVGGGR